MDFLRTPAGRKLIERDIPKISGALERIAASLSSLLTIVHNEIGEEDETPKVSDTNSTKMKEFSEVRTDLKIEPPWKSS